MIGSWKLGVTNELRGDRADFPAFAVIFGDVQDERLAVHYDRRREPQPAIDEEPLIFKPRRGSEDFVRRGGFRHGFREV